VNTHQTASCAPLTSSQGIPRPASASHEEGSAACRNWATPTGGEERLSNAEREAAIKQCAREIEQCMADRQKYLRDYDVTNCFGDKGLADGARLKAQEAAGRMAALIRGRSAAVIAQMEAEQAERMALEPGAQRIES
jgi:hypothetical protein